MTRKKPHLSLDRRTLRALQPDEVRAVAGGMTSDTYPPHTHIRSECRRCAPSDLC